LTVGEPYTPPGQSVLTQNWWCLNFGSEYRMTEEPFGANPYCNINYFHMTICRVMSHYEALVSASTSALQSTGQSQLVSRVS
jgi:hypothetical protein